MEDGWETRKIVRYRDGRVQRARPDGATGDTQLSETRMLSAEEIAADPQFTVEPMTVEDFEMEWRTAGAS